MPHAERLGRLPFGARRCFWSSIIRIRSLVKYLSTQVLTRNTPRPWTAVPWKVTYGRGPSPSISPKISPRLIVIGRHGWMRSENCRAREDEPRQGWGQQPNLEKFRRRKRHTRARAGPGTSAKRVRHLRKDHSHTAQRFRIQDRLAAPSQHSSTT